MLPSVVLGESIATLRTALFPLARLHPLPSTPNSTNAPIIMVHGYLGHPDHFRPLTRRLLQEGFGQIHRIGYPSTRLRLEEICHRISEVVVPLEEEHGKVLLIGHSLGAVACRAYLKIFGGSKHVSEFISLGGPHAGTSLYRFTPPHLWKVLDPRGPWVQRLQQGDEPVHTTVIRARYDQQVLPPIRASLPGVNEIVLHGLGHNGLLWSSDAHDAVIQVLKMQPNP